MPYCTLFKPEISMLLTKYFSTYRFCSARKSPVPPRIFFTPLAGCAQIYHRQGDGIVRPPGALLRREAASLTTGSRGCCAPPALAAAPYPSASAVSAFTLSAARIPAVLSISSITCLHSLVANAADRIRFSSLSSKR